MQFQVNDNPYAPPSDTLCTGTAVTIHLLLLAVLWLATVLAGWYLFGTSGKPPAENQQNSQPLK